MQAPRVRSICFRAAAAEQVSAFLVTGSPFFSGRRDQIVALAVRYAIPIIYPWREYVDAGGLMSYGTQLTWAYNVIGQYAGESSKVRNQAICQCNSQRNST